MAKCPECTTPGAYIGMFTVECKNSKCKHFTITEEVVCPCCGIAGHEGMFVGMDMGSGKDKTATTVYDPASGKIIILDGDGSASPIWDGDCNI